MSRELSKEVPVGTSLGKSTDVYPDSSTYPGPWGPPRMPGFLGIKGLLPLNWDVGQVARVVHARFSGWLWPPSYLARGKSEDSLTQQGHRKITRSEVREENEV